MSAPYLYPHTDILKNLFLKIFMNGLEKLE